VISNTNTGITTRRRKYGTLLKFNDQETFVILWFCTFICFSAFGQEKLQPTELGKTKVDSLYREDQFYLGLNYNTPKQTCGYKPAKISLGVTAGFLRDMPINKIRNVAIASGLGFALNNYNENFVLKRMARLIIQ
jgi:hypothetical protein